MSNKWILAASAAALACAYAGSNAGAPDGAGHARAIGVPPSPAAGDAPARGENIESPNQQGKYQ